MKFVDLATRLSVDECQARLRSGMDPEWKIFGGKIFRGRIWGAKDFRIRRVRWSGRANPAIMTGCIFRNNDGTVIRYRFRRSPIVSALFSIWYWGVCMTSGIGFLAISREVVFEHNIDWKKEIVGYLAVTILPAIAIMLNVRIKRRDKEDLSDILLFMKDNLKVYEISKRN